MLELDIQMDNSDLLFYDRIINGGMVACQIRNGLSYGIKSNIPHEKHIFRITITNQKPNNNGCHVSPDISRQELTRLSQNFKS